MRETVEELSDAQLAELVAATETLGRLKRNPQGSSTLTAIPLPPMTRTRRPAQL